MPIFEPPVVRDWTFAGASRNPGERRYWNYYGTQPRGRSVLKLAGVWTTVDYPTTTQIASADLITDSTTGEQIPAYFNGGHVYSISDEIAAELAAAGYTITYDTEGGYALGYSEGY